MTLRHLPFVAVAFLATGCIIEPGELDERPDGGPPPNCLAVPVCDDGWVEVDACPQDDADCREHTLCGTTISCTPADQCLALPSCRRHEEQSEAPCAEHEALCRVVSLCGATLYCREDVSHCEAYPVCEAGDEESEIACDPDADEPCYTRSVCGYTIHCRPGPMCAAVPTCEPWEVGSDVACDDDEWGCRAEAECGGIIYCREDPCADGAAEPAPPPDDEDDGDGDGDEDGEERDEAPRDPIVACP